MFEMREFDIETTAAVGNENVMKKQWVSLSVSGWCAFCDLHALVGTRR
jgi:hypothetical protein